MKEYLFVILILIIIFIFHLLIKLVLYIKIKYKIYFSNLNNYMNDDILISKYENKTKNKTKNKTIPKVIYQTYNNKNKVPSIVFKNIKKYCKEYLYSFYNDEDCKNILKKYFQPKVLNKFNSMKKGCHKADLFRYCILYLYGGYYIDIKSILIKPLNDVFENSYNFYSVLALGNKTIYQGILASYPRNDILKRSINFILDTSNEEIDFMYTIFIEFLYHDIRKCSISKKVKEGENVLINYDTVYLFKEECCEKTCPDKPKDRYGRYCVIKDKDKDEIVFETRFIDFPWK